MPNITIKYFAQLRSDRGLGEETLTTDAATTGELYAELKTAYGFALSAEKVRASVNAEFVPWNQPLADGDTVVFIPPVAGG